MSAARWNCADVIPVLLAGGADINVRDRGGRSALTWAKEAKNREIVDVLTKAGAH
jgi:ankyrin repeat protein